MLFLALILTLDRVEALERVRDYNGFLATTNDLMALERATVFKIGDKVRRTGLSVESKKITKVLSFLGVSCGALTIAEVLSSNAANWENSSECKLMGSVDTFLSLIEALERDPS